MTPCPLGFSPHVQRHAGADACRRLGRLRGRGGRRTDLAPPRARRGSTPTSTSLQDQLADGSAGDD